MAASCLQTYIFSVFRISWPGDRFLDIKLTCNHHVELWCTSWQTEMHIPKQAGRTFVRC